MKSLFYVFGRGQMLFLTKSPSVKRTSATLVNSVCWGWLIILFAYISPMSNCYGQNPSTPSDSSVVEQQIAEIVSPDALDRLVEQHITYAITGEKVPTGGVKVDLTKAVGTLTGFINNPNGIDVSIDLSLGVTEGTAALFDSHKNLHSDFNATINLIYIPRSSSAYMGQVPASIVRTNRISFQNKISINRKDSLLCLLLISHKSRLRVLDYTGNSTPFDIAGYTLNELGDQGIRKADYAEITNVINSAIARSHNLKFRQPADTAQLTVAQQEIIRGLSRRYFPSLKTNKLFELLAQLDSAVGRSDLLLDDLLVAVGKIISMKEDNITYQMKISERHWLSKRLRWWTLSPFIRREGFSLYEGDLTQRKDTSSITFGVGVRRSYLFDWKNALVYLNAGGDLFKANNIADFKKVEFVEQDSLASAGSKDLFAEKKGVSYASKDIKLDHGFGLRFSAELYVFLSKKNFIPGVYFKYDHTFSKVLKNNSTAAFEIGLPFNINSPDRNKSVVSVAPYLRFPNLRAPDQPEIENEIDHDDFQVGIRIGLPVHFASR